MKASEAFDELFRNTQLFIITLIVAIIGGIITAIITIFFGVGISISSIFGVGGITEIIYKLVLSLIVSIFYMYALTFSIYSYKRRWNTSMAFSNIGIVSKDAIIAGIALGLSSFVFSFIPIVGMLIIGLIFMGLALSIAIAERGYKIEEVMEKGFYSIPQLFSSDPDQQLFFI